MRFNFGFIRCTRQTQSVLSENVRYDFFQLSYNPATSKIQLKIYSNISNVSEAPEVQTCAFQNLKLELLFKLK